MRTRWFLRSRLAGIGLLGSLALLACDTSDPVAGPVLNLETAANHVPGITTAHSPLHAFGKSGIQGRIEVVDDGASVAFTGWATGMDPNDTYLSLIYDVKSLPGGPLACEPLIFDPSDPDFILPTMLIGFWTVDANGHGTLNQVGVVDDRTGQRVYVPVSKFRTISIRAASIGFERVACGIVATHGAR